jgi:hypothetical protein
VIPPRMCPNVTHYALMVMRQQAPFPVNTVHQIPRLPAAYPICPCSGATAVLSLCLGNADTRRAPSLAVLPQEATTCRPSPPPATHARVISRPPAHAADVSHTCGMPARPLHLRRGIPALDRDYPRNSIARRAPLAARHAWQIASLVPWLFSALLAHSRLPAGFNPAARRQSPHTCGMPGRSL